jgi:hypothetical protein
MKKLTSAFLLLMLCVACSKNEDSPDLSLVLQGAYRLNFLQINRQDLIPSSTTTTTGIVTVTRSEKDAINMTLALTDPNGNRSFSLGKFTLKDEGGGTVGIYDTNNASVGRGSSADISFSVVLGPSSFGLRGTR